MSNPVEDLAYWWRKEKGRRLCELTQLLGTADTSIHYWRKQRRIPVKHLKKLEAIGFKVNQKVNKRREYTSRAPVDDLVTLKLIAAELGVSRERARRCVISAMASFKKELNKRGISMDDVLNWNR